jgi:plastocyanin
LSSRRAEAAVLLAALALALGALPLPARATSPAPSAAQAETAYTLYGDIATGWGNRTNAITNPGPTLYVYAGDNVTLTLYSTQTGVVHDWFIDFNKDKRPDGSEPTSPDFSSQATPLVWSFIAPLNATGIWPYLCKYHTITMTGQIVILSPKNVTLYGSVGAGGVPAGWGFTNASITEPGPTLYLLAGVNVTLHLISADGQTHTWFIDYDNGTSPTGGEPASLQFQSTPIDFQFAPDRTGTFLYRCGIHPIQMTGTVVIVGAVVIQAAPSLGLIPMIMIVTIVLVLVLAAVYQVRAVRAARRTK